MLTHDETTCQATPLVEAPPVVCSRCGESVVWRDEAAAPLEGSGYFGKWFHVRTGVRACLPLCTVEGCDREAVQALGYHGFDGGSSRFIRTGWRCSQHRELNAIEWT